MIVRKGQRMHRLAGKVFFPAMLIMASLSAYGALFKPEAIPGTLLLAVPVIAVILASLFWLLRVLLSAQYRNA